MRSVEKFHRLQEFSRVFLGDEQHVDASVCIRVSSIEHRVEDQFDVVHGRIASQALLVGNADALRSSLFRCCQRFVVDDERDFQQAFELAEGAFAVVAVRIDRVDVGEIEPLQNVHDGARLIRIGRHGACEVIERGFAELGRGRRVRDLRQLKQPQEIGHVDAYGTQRRADHAEHVVVVHGIGQRTVVARAHARRETIAYESKGLLECVVVVGARVQDQGAEVNAGQQVYVPVDLLDGEEHRLQTLNATVFADRAARFTRIVVLVHGKQAAQCDVASETRRPACRRAGVVGSAQHETGNERIVRRQHEWQLCQALAREREMDG